MAETNAFDRIIGYEEIKAELEEIADVLKETERYARLGVRPPKGLLLSCKRLSDLTGIRFEPDVVASKNHKRLDPTFYRLKTPPERNLILYDDIITTGSTLLATRELFPEKNIITIVNVCNRGATM